MLNRRSILQFMGLFSTWPVRLHSDLASPLPTASIYEELGVQPFINAAGAFTNFGGALMADEVMEAMQEVSRHSTSITELQAAVGSQIATMLNCEAALVTAGCASSLALATAACVAGKDPRKIQRLPEIAGMKNEVVMQKAHRFEYDHAIRNTGAKLIEIESADELKGAVSNQTAMLFFVNSFDSRGKIRREEFARLANGFKIPALIDAAADLPPVENLYDLTRMGYDLVAFSGGKSLRGPQCSGLLLGKQDLIEAAFLNDSPHSDSIGRVSKVGKEEIVGLYRALQLFVRKDHVAERSEWERRVSVIARELSAIPGVTTEMVIPEVPHNRPQLNLQWDRQRIPLAPKDIVGMLRSGSPRIELIPGSEESSTGLDVTVWMLRPNEETIVAQRLSEILITGSRSGHGAPS